MPNVFNCSKSVLVIGAGGIGSFIIPLLDKVGLYNITVADPDTVENKNLPYQNFKKGHVGQNKSQVMMDSYESINHFSKYHVLKACGTLRFGYGFFVPL